MKCFRGWDDVEVERLEQFIRAWRILLLETLEPKNMPEGWHVDTPMSAGRWSGQQYNSTNGERPLPTASN